jgi:hypothetical protein
MAACQALSGERSIIALDNNLLPEAAMGKSLGRSVRRDMFEMRGGMPLPKRNRYWRVAQISGLGEAAPVA